LKPPAAFTSAGKNEFTFNSGAGESKFTTRRTQVGDFNRSDGNPLDLPAVAAERSFVFQVSLSVIGNWSRWNGERSSSDGICQKLPGQQNLPMSEHQIPVLAVFDLMV